MSDKRKVGIRYNGTLPQNSGNNGVKLELFHCSQFKPDFKGVFDWSQKRHDYRPPIPIRHLREDSNYWERPLYRVRIDEKWVQLDGYKMAFFTPVEVFLRWMQFDVKEVIGE